jgi:hypothetical protein
LLTGFCKPVQLRLIVGVFTVYADREAWRAGFFLGIKPLISLALFLDSRPYFSPKKSAFDGYGRTTAVPAPFGAASPSSQRPGVFRQGYSFRSGKLEGFLRASIPRREGFAPMKPRRILLDLTSAT